MIHIPITLLNVMCFLDLSLLVLILVLQVYGVFGVAGLGVLVVFSFRNLLCALCLGLCKLVGSEFCC